MRNVVLADGSVYPVDLCNIAFGRLQINIIDSAQTVRGVAIIFGDPEKSAEIQEGYEGIETPLNTYAGYTELVSVGLSDKGVYLTLRKPAK